MIQFLPVNNIKTLSKVRKLYLQAFPKFERLPFWYLMVKSRKKESNLYVVYDDNAYVGLLNLAYYKDIVYVYYLAIVPSQQSKGYGSEILQHLRKIYPDKRLLLNIEKVDPAADNYQQRLNRKKFYEKNGFKNTNFEIEAEEVVYEILYFGKMVSEDEYHDLFDAYLGRVFEYLFLR